MIALSVCLFVASASSLPTLQTAPDRSADPRLLDAPRTLTEEGRENLVAFARLFGVVRYFHPSDQNEEADWEGLAIAAVGEVEGAADADELAATLLRVFAPVAPTLRVFAGEAPAVPAELQRPAELERLYLRAWRHVGLGLSVNNVYSSRRTRKRSSGAALPAGWSDPSNAYAVELPRGVTALVPLCLFDDGEGTLPRPGPDAQAILEPPPGHVASGNDRATRLADVVLAWNVFEHFYPYFDVVDADWDAELVRALEDAAEDPDERAFLDTLRRLVAALADGHGNVLHLAALAPFSLPLAWEWIEEQLVITHFSGSSGEGPAPGDVVVAIDGRPTGEVIRELESLISSATPQWRRFAALRELRTSVRPEARVLELLSTANEDRPYEVELTPGPVQGLEEEPRPDPIEMLWEGIWYVDLGRITDADFKDALADLAAAEGLIFDLRGYPAQIGPQTFFSHLIREPVQSAFFDKPVLTRPHREAIDWDGSRWNLQPAQPTLTANRAFLTGGGAISYAESCMGIVEAYELAEIVGSATAGTNGNINPFALPGDYRVIWTGMRVTKHDGTPHHGVGIQPTVPVERTRAGVAEGQDEVLERAIALLRERAGH